MTLFGHAGVLLPLSEPGTPMTPFEIPAQWQWRGLSITGVQPESPSTEVQLPLALPPAPGRKVARAISPGHAVFMNITLCGFFGRDPHLRSAAENLTRRGILYLGDLTRMSADELRFRLPHQHRGFVDKVEQNLAQIGLTLGAEAPWWRRPRDYYACAY